MLRGEHRVLLAGKSAPGELALHYYYGFGYRVVGPGHIHAKNAHASFVLMGQAGDFRSVDKAYERHFAGALRADIVRIIMRKVEVSLLLILFRRRVCRRLSVSSFH